jgi:hypothetical protein
MKTATGLALIAVGAILTFALTAQPSFLNLHVVGWVLMLTGAVGIAVPRAQHGRLRRRTVWRGTRPMHEIEIEETDTERKFSSLLAPEGIDSGLLTRDPPGVPVPPEMATRQPSEHDQQA